MKTSKLSPRAKLAKNSKRDPATGCLIWQGGRSTNGYGITTTVDGQSISTHRLAWMLENGPIPPTFKGKDSVISHKCCQRCCIEPSHLQLDNQQGNMAHPVTKARQKNASKRRGPSLTDAQLTEIHKHIDDGKSGYFIAALTGRSEPHISAIRRRYNEQKKQEAQTNLLKDVNRRLTDLLFPSRVKKPCGSAPAPQTGSKVRGA